MADPTGHIADTQTTADLIQLFGRDSEYPHDFLCAVAVAIKTADGDITEESTVTVDMVLPGSNQWTHISTGPLGAQLGDPLITGITRDYGVSLLNFLNGTDTAEAAVLDGIASMFDRRKRWGQPPDWYRRDAVEDLVNMSVSDRLGAIIERAWAATLTDEVLEWDVAEVMGTKNHRAALAVILGNGDRPTADTADARSHQVYVLKRIAHAQDDPRAVQALIATMRHDVSDLVRSDAAFALDTLADPRATSALIAALNDDSEFVRTCAAWALLPLGASQAEPALIAQLCDTESNARLGANAALATCGGAAALFALTQPGQGMDDPEAFIRAAALESYQQIAQHLRRR